MKLVKLALAGVVLLSACNTKMGSVKDSDLKDADKKASYAIGLAMAKDMQANVGQLSKNYKDLDTALIYAALSEYLSTGKMRIDSAEMQTTLTEWQKSAAEKKAKADQLAAGENMKKGDEFIAQQMAANPKLKKTESGLVYEVISEGSGAKPSLKSTVKVNYKGTLIDGTVFDESKGQPVEFGVGQVIKGWTEGLQLMTAGSKYRFLIPAALAYGDKGASEQIKPGATLVFDVDLLEVK